MSEPGPKDETVELEAAVPRVEVELSTEALPAVGPAKPRRPGSARGSARGAEALGAGPRGTPHELDVYGETAVEPGPPPSSQVPKGGDPAASFESGRYRVVRELGRGGMGIVLEAVDSKLERRVALKVLLAGDFASADALERFQVEARAAARLSHRNLVGVHEVGEEGGRHFLVMDFVDGESLAERLKRDGPLPPRDAAWLTLRLADALYYAHTRAILHRDVKPANVLIDRDGEPLLTDFGLAKELDSVGPGLTASGFVVGTPAYMSPEQAHGTSDELDRRSDIYSLGATLYEMLVGRPPFVAPNVAALLKAVLEQEPPSVRTARGEIDRQEVDRDLETICLKCLEKEPSLRYGSARALQEDLERYLAHESILARRPGAVERGRKWLRRNRLLARTLSGTLLLAVVTLGVITGLFVRELKLREAAAESAASQAMRALDTLVFQVHGKLDDLPGERVRSVRRELLAKALDELLQVQNSSPALALRTSEALRKMSALARDAGELTVARNMAERSLEVSRGSGPEDDQRVRRNVALSLVAIADVDRQESKTQDSLRRVDEAVELLRDAQPLPGEPAHEVLLAYLEALVRKLDLLRTEGQLDQALAIAREAEAGASRLPREVAALERSAIHDALGRTLERKGDLRGATQAFERGIEMARAAVRKDPGSPQARLYLLTSFDHIARLRRTQGDLEGALQAARQGLEVGESVRREDPESLTVRRHLVTVRVELADTLDSLGRQTESAAPLEQALDDCRALIQNDPQDGEGRQFLTALLDRLGGIETRRGNLEAAQRYLEESLRVAQEAMRRAPDSKMNQRGLATAIERRADLYARKGDLARSRADYEEVLRLRQQLGDSRDALLERSSVQVHLAELSDRQGKLDEALELFEAAAKTRTALREQEPRDIDVLHSLAMTHCKRGGILQRLKRGAEARQALTLADELVRDLLKVSPRHGDARRLLATVLMQLGDVDRDEKKPASARASYEAALRERRELFKEAPQDRQLERAIEISLSRLADLQQGEGQTAAARSTYEELLETQRARARRASQDSEARRDMLVGLVKLADLRRGSKDPKDQAAAASLLEEAEAAARELLKQDASNAEAEHDLLGILTRLGTTRLGLGKQREAGEAFQEAARLTDVLLGRREDPARRQNLSALLLKCADLARALGDDLGARTYLRRLVQNHRVLAEQDPQKHSAQLGRLEALLARQERHCALLTGDQAPRTPDEQLTVARARLKAGDAAAAVTHYREALKDAAIRDDPRHYFEGALAAGRAASQAKADERGAFQAQGLEWLRIELETRRAQLQQLAGMLEKATDGQERAQLLDYRDGIAGHIHEVEQATDPAVAVLREHPGWKKLFP
ncbi:MAG: protein kinase [Planctomycetota bacterium]